MRRRKFSSLAGYVRQHGGAYDHDGVFPVGRVTIDVNGHRVDVRALRHVGVGVGVGVGVNTL